MAHSVACALYAVGFGAYFGEVIHEFGTHLIVSPEILKKILAVLVVVIFTFINYRGAKETGKERKKKNPQKKGNKMIK